MRTFLIILTLLALICESKPVVAQKIFSEGVIKYDVYINDEPTAGGVYVISVKGGNIRRELAMNNGFNNITIYTVKNGKTLSINMADENKYALEMTQVEVNEKNKKFSGAVFSPLNEKRKIAGFDCDGNRVKYPNNEEASFYFTRELLPPTENFIAMFPGLKGLPLEYKVKSGDKMTMKFVAKLVDNLAIDSKVFDIPAEYKIVTMAELEKLK